MKKKEEQGVLKFADIAAGLAAGDESSEKECVSEIKALDKKGRCYAIAMCVVMLLFIAAVVEMVRMSRALSAGATSTLGVTGLAIVMAGLLMLGLVLGQNSKNINKDRDALALIYRKAKGI